MSLISPSCQLQGVYAIENSIIIWDVATGQAIGPPLTKHTAGVTDIAFSPDDHILASASRDNRIILWDAATGRPLEPVLEQHEAPVLGLAFSLDGQILASASADKTIILWNATNGRPLGTPLTGHTDFINDVAFSPDGRTMASAGKDKTIILWDVTDPNSPQPLGSPLTGHADDVLSVAFSPDGQLLATASQDQTIILWDVTDRSNPQLLGSSLTGHTDSVRAVAFSPDGKWLASGGADETVLLWASSLESWQVLACQTANRNLISTEWQMFMGDALLQATCSNLPLVESVPSLTPMPTPTATATQATPADLTSGSGPIGTTEVAQFALLKPTSIENPTFGPTEFEWQWNGPVDDGQGFEIRVWREGEPAMGVHNAVLDNQNGTVRALGNDRYQLNVDITDASGVRGRSGECWWKVLLVQISPDYKELGVESQPARLRLEVSGSGGGGGGGGGGGDGGDN